MRAIGPVRKGRKRNRFGSQTSCSQGCQPLRVSNVQIRLHLCGEDVTVTQLSTDPPAGKIEPNVWNVLVAQRAGTATNPAALRPATAPASLFDLFGLSEFPTLAVAHRFSVFSTTSSA